MTKTGPAGTDQAPGPLRQGLDAARANLVPGLILQGVALAFVLAYFYWPPANEALGAVADFKQRLGYLFSLPSTAFFGGVLPLFFFSFQKGGGEERPWSHLAFYVIFWAIKGFEVDTLYRFQAWLFGDNREAATLVCKVLVDQFLYVPFWAAPSMALGYLWKDSGYSLKTWRARLGPRWIKRRILPLLLANWFVWVPAVAIIYCVELPLQLPLQNLILCMWCLMVSFMTRRATSLSKEKK
jgi:hypothetical protein